MSFAGNPFSSAPRLPSPVKRTKRLSSLHAHTASRSTARPRDVDLLLRDLSPTTTLQAFRADPSSADMALGSTSADVLARSIASSSESERALGVKAAQSCLDLRTWTREMESWTWPRSFDVPEFVRRSMRSGGGSAIGEDGEEYWGSLPAKTVRAYEQRADEIGQLLDEMDVEELKEYVLSSHYRASSRPPSRSHRLSTMSTLDMVSSDIKRLDDFTALVTATILQALPYLSHLSKLMDVWTIRLIILRNAPQYLRDLERTRAELNRAWATISVSLVEESTINREAVFQLKSSFERQVGSLGRKLDRFLDDLEGREDRVPDSWIDDFENLESAYGTWVAQADRRLLESEWRRSRESQSARTIIGANEHIPELEAPSQDAEAVRRMSAETSLSNDPFGNFDQTSGDELQPSSPSIEAVPTPALPRDSRSLQTTNSNMRSISERLSLNVEEPISNRSVSEGATQAEVGGRSVATRRAAFLNDIERTNSLKLASKSPVRPFEHASNAFTRLFKKDHIPEKARPVPMRSGSGKSGFNTQLNSVIAASVAAPNSESPTGVAAKQTVFSSGGAGMPVTSHESESARETLRNNATPAHRTSSANATPQEPVYVVQGADGFGHIIPETYKPRGPSPPPTSPDKVQVPEDWPLGGESNAAVQQEDSRQQLEHVDRSSYGEQAVGIQTPDAEPGPSELTGDSLVVYGEEHGERPPRGVDGPRDGTVSPMTPLATDAFDRMFVETLPQPPSETAGLVNVPERSPSWTGSQRPLSIPESQRPGLVRRSSINSSYLDNAAPSTPSTMLEIDSVTSPLGTEEDERKWVKRASATFIEAFPRSELRSIDVKRPSSPSPRRSLSVNKTSSPEYTPEATTQSAETTQIDQALDACSASIYEPDTPTSASNHSSCAIAEEAVAPLTTPVLPSSPVEEVTLITNGEPASPTRPAPLNAVMMKRRGKANDENNMPTYTLSPASPSKKTANSRQGEDSFDRHVSEVLSTLPAPIKFRSRPGAETPVNQHRAAEGQASVGPRLKNAPAPRVPSRTGMMIAPAEPSPKKYISASDSEVKLYHLTQSGRDEPIKLFVRLVGEGERVMVRVGGGWADLADYLRQYAEHHGSRTVSDGGLELQPMLNGHPRRISGAVELKPRTAPTTPVPDATPFRPGSRDGEQEWSQHRPGSSGLADVTNASPFAARAQTPTLYGTPRPKSSNGSSNSRPTTANGHGGLGSSRPSSRQSTTADGYGLAGPSSTGRRGLPDHKAKWVDSMIERAKASAEKSKESASKEKYFGELGKAGGTRRLVFRTGSGTGGPEK